MKRSYEGEERGREEKGEEDKEMDPVHRGAAKKDNGDESWGGQG